MIGSRSQLIRGTAILAIDDGSEKVTRALLDDIPIDYAATSSTPPRRRAISCSAASRIRQLLTELGEHCQLAEGPTEC
ncbi:hypothetical protein OHA40_25095 [Nocardia sp. NBC_00508]|uniref:hypothetical protein n=1 Tax=Nocardia sp. NBC_00508 TaxID=2975992 RepID=UPI002E8202D1|nr:hypothetical protein [Nocardia sp. NBC_00508]WUD64927.1 hypothetical protein OHA40_25095 [Nocardia sp. NBC_00508]